jgi:hypothetical protein
VKEHWIYGKEDGWARLRYDPKTKTFDVLANRGENAVRYTIFHNPNFNPRDKSPYAQASRWQTSVPDVQGKFKVMPPSPGKPAAPPPSGRASNSPEEARPSREIVRSSPKGSQPPFKTDNPLGRVRLGGTGALPVMFEGPVDQNAARIYGELYWLHLRAKGGALYDPADARSIADPIVIQEAEINILGHP